MIIKISRQVGIWLLNSTCRFGASIILRLKREILNFYIR
ncbi:hypothetical protein CAMGR0001_0124 [Campylobacter gracilis RM3268]|uniref:Uncharacterized protein n=1 Tax=Campylobacter gracilis RM3268 TaxID=553220 RepID=C8PKA9_9BACT|nr:hypothetical protein CAMGR0001_0124 [Campylobacter gracilis RM3268]